MSKINLHIHSTFSDGALSPEELVKKAKKEEMAFLALTDHDSVGGMKRFFAACRKNNVSCVSGVEISTEYEEHEYHILGYNVDIKNKFLLEILKKQREARQRRTVKIIEKFRKLSFEINNKIAKEILKNESVGKPHIRDLILSSKKNIQKLKKEYKFDAETGDFIDMFMDKAGQIGFVRKKKIPTRQAIAAIKKAGGIAILAHPGFEFKSAKEFQEKLEIFTKWGLKGVEIFYPYRDASNNKKIGSYLKFCKKHNLIITAGSDDHSGKTIGAIKTPKKEEIKILDQFNDIASR